jgi:sec-independent protein translocase protein TatC
MVIIFIIAAFLTPPDVISQIALAIPLLLLYEISILICKKIEKKHHA